MPREHAWASWGWWQTCCPSAFFKRRTDATHGITTRNTVGLWGIRVQGPGIQVSLTPWTLANLNRSTQGSRGSGSPEPLDPWLPESKDPGIQGLGYLEPWVRPIDPGTQGFWDPWIPGSLNRRVQGSRGQSQDPGIRGWKGPWNPGSVLSFQGSKGSGVPGSLDP